MINLPLSVKTQPPNALTPILLNLKIGQQLEANILQIDTLKNTIQLSIANKQIAAILNTSNSDNQSQQGGPLQTGQTLKLQVLKLHPQTELKILLPEIRSDLKNTLNDNTTLTLKATATNTPANSPITDKPSLPLPFILTSPARDTNNRQLATLKNQQQLSATVIQNNSKSLTLQLFMPEKPTSALTITAPKTQNIKPVIIEFSKANFSKEIFLPRLKLEQPVTLEVIKTAQQLQFKILPASASNTEQSIAIALRETLPKEIPVPVLLNQLLRDVPSLITNEHIPETLKRLAREILSNLPETQHIIDNKTLKNALNNSGTYLEAKLAHPEQQSNTLLKADFKAALLKILLTLQHDIPAEKTAPNDNEQINSLLKELQTKSEGALARLLLNQLKSLPQEDQNKQVWLLDLPFIDKKHVKSVQVQIEKNHKKSTTSEQKTWSATLTLTPPQLSTLHCKISYFDNAVHTNFWSEDRKTTKLMQDNINYLRARFEEAGLTPGNMNATQQSTVTTSHTLTIDKNHLFDDNA